MEQKLGDKKVKVKTKGSLYIQVSTSLNLYIYIFLWILRYLFTGKQARLKKREKKEGKKECEIITKRETKLADVTRVKEVGCGSANLLPHSSSILIFSYNIFWLLLTQKKKQPNEYSFFLIAPWRQSWRLNLLSFSQFIFPYFIPFTFIFTVFLNALLFFYLSVSKMPSFSSPSFSWALVAN